MKIVLGIEYNGSDFHGWQSQDNVVTLQGTLEQALTKIANVPIKVFCAGRTDAGVHATGQVVHFETDVIRNPRAWTLGANMYLPSSMSVRWMQEVDEHFHARFSATARRYRYVIYNHSLRPALLSSRVTWHYYPLDDEAMRQAAAHLLGKHDFSSFRSSACQSKTPIRTVTEISIKRVGDFIYIEIEANAFLHHMVRNIAGVLMQIGSGWQQPDWALQVLHSKDRRAAAETASPHGLYLIEVKYPESYPFPTQSALGLI